MSGTEFLQSNKPSFSFNNLLSMEYQFAQVQRIRFVFFQVDIKNKLSYMNKDWKGKPKLGKLVTSIGEIISNKGTVSFPLL